MSHASPTLIPVVTIPAVLAERIEAALAGTVSPLVAREVLCEVRSLVRTAKATR